MLEFLKKQASGWVAKILIGLLIASFAVWGIADQFTGRSEQVLAKIGEQQISLEQFRTTYRDRISALSQQYGQRITTAQARQMGLPDRVLEQLVNIALLELHARELGLSVSQDAVTQSIVSRQVFQDSSGNFSRANFERFLQYTNLTEARLLAQERDTLIRQQILGTVTQAPQVPETLLSAINRYLNEERVIAHFTVGPDDVGEIRQPDDSALRSYYDANTDQFMAPETREVAVLDVTPDVLAGRVDVTDEAVRADYEARKAQYVKPEKRVIRQIVFPDMAAAQQGYAALLGGKSFMEVAKQHGMSESDTKLGTLTKDDIPDDKISEAAFSLEQGGISSPVEGQFSTVILKVTEIQPGKSKSFEAVKDEIRKELERRAAAERIIELRGSIEDERAAGAPLAEIAQKFDLPYETVTLDRDGKTPEGDTAAHPADLQKFRDAVFASSVGADEDPIEKANGGLVWYEVQNVNPAKKRLFENVREKVTAAWRAEQLSEAVKDRATKLVEQVRGGNRIEDVAKSINARVTRTEPIKRNASASALTSAALGRAFTMPKGGVTSASAPKPPARTVLSIEKVIAPGALAGQEAEQLRMRLRSSLEQDVAEQYLAALRENFDYTVNRDVLSQALGL